MADRTINLIDDRSVTAMLLGRPLDWRIRAVEEVVVDAASTCLRRRSLQVAPLRHHLVEYVSADTSEQWSHALLAVHVAPVPRGPLLDFDVEGPDGPASVLPRTEIARREAVYLETLANDCGHEVSDQLRPLLVALLGFSGTWNPDDETLRQFVREAVPLTIDVATMDAWAAVNDRCGSVLGPRVESVELDSAPQNPLVVVPELYSNGFFATVESVTDVLEKYAGLLEDLDRISQSDHECAAVAEEFLSALGDYGYHYDLMVVLRAPLDEPFVVKYSERRNLSIDNRFHESQQELVIADARTNHVTLKVDDPNVRIVGAMARKVGSDGVADGPLVSRSNDQYVAFYSHDPNRDYRIRVVFTLSLLRRLEYAPLFASALVLLLTVALWDSDQLEMSTLAVVAGPSALAVSVLLGREQSTLGSRLRVRSTAILAASLVVLVVSVCILYVTRVR